MTRHIAPALMSAALAATGCEEADLSCTLADCEDRAHVAIDGPVEAWVDGEYFLDIRLLRQHRCTFALPFSDGISGQVPMQPMPISCAPELPGLPPAPAPRSAVSFRQLIGGPEGCGRTDASRECDVQAYRIDIEVDAVAEDVDIRLAIGETVLLDRTASFEYLVLQPNGPECGPTCRIGEVQMVISPP